MDVEKLLYRRFIEPMENRQIPVPRVGIELEYPLVCLRAESNKSFVKYYFHRLIGQGFIPLYNGKQEMVGVEKKFVVRISLDTSYNNLKMAFYPTAAIHEIEPIWKEVTRNFLENFAERALLIDVGVHPLIHTLPANFLNDDHLFAKRKFIEQYSQKDFHGRGDFLAFISSAQTHLEFTPEELPYAMHVLSTLDFAELMLFANSPLKTAEGWFRCARYYFYTRCAFYQAGLTGSIDQEFHSIQEVMQDYAKRSLFFRWREQCQFFAPVRLADYFRQSEYAAEELDLNYFYSYRNTELKRQGTLERRIACAQPFAQTFAPAAFASGIAARLHEADELVRRFLYDHRIRLSNSERCEVAARGVAIADAKPLYSFLGALWQLAIDGLAARGHRDEVYLNCFDDKFRNLVRWHEDAKSGSV